VRVAKVDTEAVPNLGARFNIRSIPTLALFKGGREIARQAGAMGRPTSCAGPRRSCADQRRTFSSTRVSLLAMRWGSVQPLSRAIRGERQRANSASAEPPASALRIRASSASA
jgi:hypothetical protein